MSIPGHALQHHWWHDALLLLLLLLLRDQRQLTFPTIELPGEFTGDSERWRIEVLSTTGSVLGFQFSPDGSIGAGLVPA